MLWIVLLAIVLKVIYNLVLVKWDRKTKNGRKVIKRVKMVADNDLRLIFV